MTLCGFLYSVKSLYAITPTPCNECTQLVQKILFFNWMKVTLRSRQTAYIQCTELVWLRTFIVRSWCNRVEWLYRVNATVHCTVYSKIHLVGGFCVSLYVAQSRQSARLFLQSSELVPQPQEMVSPLLWFRGGDTLACGWGVHFAELMWPRKVTLRSKIRIKWLWPVKVTLKVIKRRLLVFGWSCDVVPLKWNKKNCRASSLSLRIDWA